MHHLLAVLGLATALVAPPTGARQRVSAPRRSRRRATTTSSRTSRRTWEEGTRIACTSTNRSSPSATARTRSAARRRRRSPSRGPGATVVEAVTTPPTRKAVAPRNSKLRWRGLVCGAAVALFLALGFGVPRSQRPDEGARAREVAGGARRSRGGAGDGRSLRCVRRRLRGVLILLPVCSRRIGLRPGPRLSPPRRPVRTVPPRPPAPRLVVLDCKNRRRPPSACASPGTLARRTAWLGRGSACGGVARPIVPGRQTAGRFGLQSANTRSVGDQGRRFGRDGGPVRVGERLAREYGTAAGPRVAWFGLVNLEGGHRRQHPRRLRPGA